MTSFRLICNSIVGRGRWGKMSAKNLGEEDLQIDRDLEFSGHLLIFIDLSVGCWLWVVLCVLSLYYIV